jgi:hypothetical protein
MILVLQPVFLFEVNMHCASTTPPPGRSAGAPTLATAARTRDRALLLLWPENERPLLRLQASNRDTGVQDWL